MPYAYRMFSTLPSSASVSPQVTGGLQAIDCIFYHSTGIFYQAPVDFYARRCQISHTALLIYQPPSFIERLACFIKMRTLSANCAGKLRNSPVTWLHSQPITARFAQQFAFYRFAISRFAVRRLPTTAILGLPVTVSCPSDDVTLLLSFRKPVSKRNF